MSERKQFGILQKVIEQNRCAMAYQGYGIAIFFFL